MTKESGMTSLTNAEFLTFDDVKLDVLLIGGRARLAWNR